MRIQVVTYGVSRYAGGVLGAVSGLFTNKQFSDKNVNIISFKDDMSELDRHLWGSLPMRLFKANKILYSRKAKNYLMQSDADILHMECLWRWPQRWMTSWKKKKRKPVVCSPHGMLDSWIIKDQGKMKRIIAKMLFDKALESVDCFHALCKQEFEDIRQYGITAPVAIIPNGVDLPEENLKKTMWKEQTLYRTHKYHLLYLGRLHPKKGVDILLDALCLMKKYHKEKINLWHIDIVGWGDSNYVNELKLKCEQNDLSNYVSFHGEKFGEEKLRMFANSNAYILPSHGEGLPLTVLEAWSWNLPVIMTPQCNIPEGFQSQAAVKISDTVDSCYDGLMTLFSMDESALRKMGDNGYDLVCKQFSWDVVALKMIELYKWLLYRQDRPSFVHEIGDNINTLVSTNKSIYAK